MSVKQIAITVAAGILIGSCAESDLDPKVRWGAGLKGIMGTIPLASETTAKGPLDTICGATPNIPTNCVAECPAIDTQSGWYLKATLLCANQPPGVAGSGLWEATCGVFREGLQSGQDEQTSHVMTFTVVKPTRERGGSIDVRFGMFGDIFIMPFAIDKVWVDGIFFFNKSLSIGSASNFTVANMDLICRDESKVGVDMANVDCPVFKSTYYDSASCS